jgi:hypothetical protein
MIPTESGPVMKEVVGREDCIMRRRFVTCDQIKADEMGGSCSTDGDEKCI